MIPEFAIREWNEVVPWTESEQVEQDLLICRAFPSMQLPNPQSIPAHAACHLEVRHRNKQYAHGNFL